MRWYPRHEWMDGMSAEQLADWNSASWPQVSKAGSGSAGELATALPVTAA